MSTRDEGSPESEYTKQKNAAASLVFYRIGGRSYPLRSVHGCKTCASDYRFEIEKQIASGRMYRQILEHLPDDHGTDLSSMRSHYNQGHMPMEAEAARKIIEQRAEEIGTSIEAGADRLVDEHVLARTVLQRTFDGIVAGKIEPTINDGIQAARLLQQMGMEEQEVDQQAWVEAFMIFHETAQLYMDNERFREFGAALAQNPILQALIDKQNNAESPKEIEGAEDILDAEVE